MKKKKLLSLEAYKRTLVSLLTYSEIGMHLPLVIFQSKDNPIKIQNEFFYIINKEYLPSPSQQEFYKNDIIYPINYKVMRRFKRNKFSRLNRDEVL